jgi:aromatic ring-opening dioxygenase LigB subunit
MADENKKEIQVKLTQEMEQGIYANAVSVHVNQNEVILDFGYIIPNIKPTTIKVVSRTNLSHQTAESFMKVLSNALLDWRNKTAEKKENK